MWDTEKDKWDSEIYKWGKGDIKHRGYIFENCEFPPTPENIKRLDVIIEKAKKSNEVEVGDTVRYVRGDKTITGVVNKVFEESINSIHVTPINSDDKDFVSLNSVTGLKKSSEEVSENIIQHQKLYVGDTVDFTHRDKKERVSSLTLCQSIL